MSIEILVPSLPESVADATLSTWHKQAGDFVIKDENLVDLETDKIVLEVPAPASGILSEIFQQEGAIVTSGKIIAKIEIKEASDTENTLSNEVSSETTPHSPAVRRLIQETNINPQDILGSGKKGRLTKADVLDYIEKSQKPEPVVAPQQTVQPTVTADAIKPPPGNAKVSAHFRPEQRVLVTGSAKCGYANDFQ